MILYVVLTIYSFARNRLYSGLFFFSMAYGVKAGALLLMPAVLGIVHVNFGTLRLIISILFIVGFQFMLAYPFLSTETLIGDYLQRSKLTGAGRRGIQGSPEFWNYLAAHKDLSILWTFLPHHLYFDKAFFADRVKIAMLLSNVWFFFIRKACIIDCFDNLRWCCRKTLRGAETHA